jgi:hypothetical protein
MNGAFAANRPRAKKTQIGATGPMSRPGAEKEPNRLHPKAKRPNACL